MESDTELEARIKNLESRLLESNQKISNPAEASKADIEENREIDESLKKLKSKRMSLMPQPSAVSVGALSSLLSSVKSAFSSQGESQQEVAPTTSDPKALLPRSVHEQSIKDRAILLQQQHQGEETTEEGDVPYDPQLEVLQAPDLGPQILPSGQPGVEFAAQRMIHALQTNLAPPDVLERLEKKGNPGLGDMTKARPVPQQRQKIVIRLVAPPEGEGTVRPPNIVIVNKSKENLVDRKTIMERLHDVLPTAVAKPHEMGKESLASDKPSKPSLKAGLPFPTSESAASLTRQIIIIRKLPTKIHLVEDGSLILSMGQKPDESGDVAAESTVMTSSASSLVKKARGRITAAPTFGEMSSDVEKMVITDTAVHERMPKVRPPGIIVSNYYMNNREKFIGFINQLFMRYHEEISSQKEQLSCDPSSKSDFSLLTHQKIVRDYLNIYTPYRGLLLYHGLGSGKTCSSISIAEGLKTHKNIIVMTPASLRRNYVEELKKCGDDIYKKNQFWEFIAIQSPSDPMIQTLSAILTLSREFITRQRGAWLVNVKKPSNYESLNRDERISLDEQLSAMIEVKYTFLNYNGMRMSNLKTLSADFSKNPFSDHVVIIDEAHNFISRIVNKLKRKDTLPMRLYDMLMQAENIKIILLSGTPVINYPNEVAVIFNILRGYIKTWKIPLQIGSQAKIDKKVLEQLFGGVNILDYIDYNDSSRVLTITRNPFGFVNVNDRGEYVGVVRIAPEGDSPYVSDTDFERLVLTTLRGRDITVTAGSITIENHKALPDNLDIFRSYFIDAETGNVKNINMFQRRILGLASYFRSAQEQLMPAYDKSVNFRVVRIPMSDHQFAAYEKAREAERKLEKKSKSKRPGKGKAGAASGAGGGGEDIYEDAVSTYRIFSRLFCNFVFPTEIHRPLPKEGEDVEGAINDGANEEDVDAIRAEERTENLNGEHTSDDIEEMAESIAKKVDGTYSKRIEIALAKLESGKQRYLTKPQDGGELQNYSPKFLAMLENIQDPHHSGLHLVYSQFRSLEGIRIFSMVLEANGFARFQIRKDASSSWVCDIREEDKGKHMYALYTGTETDEEREIIRNIFNSTWEYVPANIKQQLQQISGNNFMGEIIKVLMITASGAEGINLRNVRWVHITEPYWQPVRIEQVIGRARRICSHNDLKDEKLRTVNVMLYIMTFTPQQMADDSSLQLRLNDVSKKNPQQPLSTDESLFEISSIKEEINHQLLLAIKQASIDCVIHRDAASKERLKCFSFGSVSSNKFAFSPSIENEESDAASARNTKQTTLKLVSMDMTIAGEKKQFAFDKITNTIYDWGSYLVAKEVGGEPLVVGKLVKNAEGKMKFVPVTEAMAAPAPSSGAVAAPVPKKKDSGSGSASASGTGGVAKSKP
jgi:superfamily II DNA or RNA helicase